MRNLMNIKKPNILQNIYKYLIKLYTYHFLPKLEVPLPFQKVYSAVLHIPVFFSFLFFTIALVYRKIQSYFLTYVNMDWSMLNWTESFYLCWLVFPLFAILFRLRSFYYVTSLTFIFFFYLVVSTIFPSLGEAIATLEMGHIFDFIVLIVSIILGHSIDYHLNTVEVNGKRKFIHYKDMD